MIKPPDDIDSFVRLHLLRIVLHGDGIAQRDIRPKLGAKDRRELETLGLLEPNYRLGNTRLIGLKLTEKAWAWLDKHSWEDFRGTLDGKSVKHLMQAVTSLLKDHQLSFVDMACRIPAVSKPQQPASTAGQNLPERIRAVYEDLRKRNQSDRIRLADLRVELSDIPRETLDQVLIELEVKGEAQLYRMDNPVEMRPQDREATLRTPTGQDRHLMYLGVPSDHTS